MLKPCPYTCPWCKKDFLAKAKAASPSVFAGLAAGGRWIAPRAISAIILLTEDSEAYQNYPIS